MMTYGLLVAGGTHGVVHALLDSEGCYKCRVSSNLTRPTMKKPEGFFLSLSIFLWLVENGVACGT